MSYSDRPSRQCKKCGTTFSGERCLDCRKANLAGTAEKRKAYLAEYYKANSEKAKAVSAKYRTDHPEKVKEWNDNWRLNNPSYESTRYANNREHHLARRKKHREENPELTKINNQRFRDNNPTYQANWQKNNRDKCSGYGKTWRERNHAVLVIKWRIHWHNRRALKKSNGGILSKGLSASLFKLQRGKCACCAKPLGNNYHLDHKMPLSLGGSNSDDNMQLLRAICNMQKGSKHPVEFMQLRGFLL